MTRLDLAARDVDALEVGVALLADADEDAAAVAAPDRAAGQLAARRALVAADAAVDVEVVGRREVARRAGAESATQRSGCVYERSGLPASVPTKATRLPSGESA